MIIKMETDVKSMLELKKIKVYVNNDEMTALDYIELLENIVNKGVNKK